MLFLAPLESLARDYWDAVETGKKEPLVEYGSDLDTLRYCSGFSKKLPNSSGIEGGENKTEINCKNTEIKTEIKVGIKMDVVEDKNIVGINNEKNNENKNGTNESREENNVPTSTSSSSADKEHSSKNSNAENSKEHSSSSNVSNGMFSDSYYERTGWNLNNIAASEGSVLKYLQVIFLLIFFVYFLFFSSLYFIKYQFLLSLFTFIFFFYRLQ